MERYEILVNTINNLIDDRINLFGYSETLEYLIDQGVPEDLLIDELQFDADDVEQAYRSWEEKNKETEEAE